MGNIEPGQNFTDPSDAEIRSDVESVLAKSATIKLASLGVVRADQAAPAVVVRADDPDAAARIAESVAGELFKRPDGTPIYEGYYFELRDSKDRPMFIQATSFRSGVGTLWFDPAYEKALDLTHLGRPSAP